MHTKVGAFCSSPPFKVWLLVTQDTPQWPGPHLPNSIHICRWEPSQEGFDGVLGFLWHKKMPTENRLWREMTCNQQFGIFFFQRKSQQRGCEIASRTHRVYHSTSQRNPGNFHKTKTKKPQHQKPHPNKQTKTNRKIQTQTQPTNQKRTENLINCIKQHQNLVPSWNNSKNFISRSST